MAELDISVVIPVYNSKNTIVECLNSVVSELEANPYTWEIICINDGSKDDSVDIIKKYAADLGFDEAKIRVITQENAGAGVARATGIKAARGEFIAFNDSDDKWLSGKIKYQMDYFKANPDVSLVCGGYAESDSLSNENRPVIYLTIKGQMYRNQCSAQTTIFKKNVIDKVGSFHPKLRYSEDYWFFNNIISHYKCVVLPKNVTGGVFPKRAWGESGLSSHMWPMSKTVLYCIVYAYRKKYISFFTFITAYIYAIILTVRRFLIKFIRVVLNKFKHHE